MFKSGKINFLILFTALTVIAIGYIIKKKRKPSRILPYYGIAKDGKQHQVPTFSFTDQKKRIVTEADFRDKIYVAEYFFATCESICPVMNKNLKGIYDTYLNDDRVMFLSHTVNPENDSSEVLYNYADLLGVKNHDKWRFVTGSKVELYGVARKGYLLNNDEGDGGADDFIHTQMFALVDWNRNLRGFYDGTKDEDIGKLTTDMRVLLEELDYSKK